MISHIAASKRPKWRILGTQGAIEADWGEELKVTNYAAGVEQRSLVPIPRRGDAWAEYYRNIADHLLLGEELNVKPRQARRVIGAIEAAEKSSSLGVSVPPYPGCE